MNTRRAVTSLAALIVGMGLIPTPIAAADQQVIKLEIGQHVFWDGEDIDQAAASSADCGEPYAEDSPCWDYGIELRKEGAHRLRVALGAILQEPGDVRDWPDYPPGSTEMLFGIELYAPPDAEHPAGELVTSGSTFDGCCTAYSVEVFADRPAAGTWRVRVIPTSVRDMSFRMRAKLEGHAQKQPAGYLSPNLRIIPPFELNFNTPTASLHPGADTDGAASSCMAEEIEEAREDDYEPPTLCLRFSMGLENAGIGRLDVRVDKNTVDERGRVILLQHQRRWTAEGERRFEACGLADNSTCNANFGTSYDCLADGTCKDEPDGSAGYGVVHKTHGHTHFQEVWKFRLLEVPEGWTPGGPYPGLRDLEKPGRKVGFEPTRELMADWTRFYQELVPDHKGGSFDLPPGWGDAYEWNRSGNYVDFPEASPGLPKGGYYVLQGIADPYDRVIESDDDDNTSYALIHVHSNGDVDLLERGYGDHPWDADRVVLTTSP